MSDGVRILVLEDQEEMRSMLSEVLREEGYFVAEAASGEEALLKFHVDSFDLVVADIRMEGMDGLDVLQQVKSEKPQVSSLVITGYSSEAETLRAVEIGVEAYLRKPFDLSVFLHHVAQLAAQRRQELDRRRRECQITGVAAWGARALAGGRAPQVSELARALALELGLSELPARQVELAALLFLLRRDQPDIVQDLDLPEAVQSILEAVGKGRQAAPLEARLAGLAIAASALLPDGEDAPPDAAVRLHQQQPERFGPGELAALENVWSRENRPVGRKDQTQLRRRLLNLAWTLERARDVAGARAALEAVLAEPGVHREGASALLGMARLESEPAARRGWAERALRTAAELGPHCELAAALEAGLEQQVPAWLELACQRAEELQDEPSAAVARVVGRLGAFPAALPILLRPQSSGALRAAGRPLARALCAPDWADEPLATRLLQRVLHESPEAARGLEGPVLERLGKSTPRFLLERLSSEGNARARVLLGESEGPPALSLRVLSLGDFQLYRPEERLDEQEWRTLKIRYLAAFLLCHRHQTLSEDRIIDEFWPDDLDRAKKSVYTSTSVLRRCLRPSAAPAGMDVVLRHHAALQLNPEIEVWHDLEKLEEAMRQGDAVPLEQAREAVDLYRGPFLEGCYMDWALRVRERCEQGLLDLLSRLAQRGQPAERLEYSRRILEVDPCHQEAHLMVMQELTRAGRPEEAVRQYEICCRALKRELEMEPGIPLVEAYYRARLA